MEYILLIFIVIFIFGQVLEYIDSIPITIFLDTIALFLVLLFSYGVTYTADWTMYSWFYKIKFDETDYVFYWLTQFFSKHNYSYEQLFQFHIVVTTFLNFFVIKKFTRNYFYVILVYYIVNYVHAVNQIRYFLGLPFILFGFYYLLQKKNILISIIMFIIGYLCHSALLVLLVFIPLYYIPIKNYFKIILLGSLGLTFIIYIIFRLKLGDALDHFGAYFGKEYNSSFLGGLFNALPYLLFFTFLFLESNNILKKHPEYFEDKKFRFLYKIAFFPIIFVFASFSVQILGHRYVLPFIIFWVIYYLYLIKDLPRKQKFLKILNLTFLNIVVVCCFYIFPDFLLKENHYTNELIDMFKSDKFLKNIFF